MRTRKLILVVLVCFLAMPLWLFGQSFTAAIRGVVADATGGSVPGAKVIVSDVARGLEFTTETDGQGRYAVPNLQPSTYMLTVEAPGFQSYQRSPFDLQVQQPFDSKRW